MYFDEILEQEAVLADYYASTAALEDYEAVGVRHDGHNPFCQCDACEADFDRYWKEHCMEMPAIQKVTTRAPYTKASLEAINASYLSEHWMSESDVEKVNVLVARIEGERVGLPVPMDGDSVICTLPDGTIYAERAHLEASSWLEEGQLSVCVHPYTPFIALDSVCSASGGPWFVADVSKLEYAGKRLKRFCAWGHMGMCRNGAIDFEAEVNAW